MPPKLSIVIPCYNERRTLRALVGAVRDCGVEPVEIILVDDGSTDGTGDVLANEIAPLVTKIIRHEKNLGKGAALRSGFAHATGDFVAVQDADLEYDPRELPRLMQPLLDGRADAVFGSRFTGGGPHRVLYHWHSLGNRFLTALSNLFTNLNLTDMECCYKIFRHDFIKGITIEENRFGFEPEITAKAARRRLRIYEAGVSYAGRTYAEGKKIGWRDGIRAIYAILKYNIWRRKP